MSACRASRRSAVFAHDELATSDAANRATVRLEDETLAACANHPPPDVIAADSGEAPEAAHEHFREREADWRK